MNKVLIFNLFFIKLDQINPWEILAQQSKCQGRTWAAIHNTGQYVSVIPGYSERIINFAIAALFVLK